MADLQNDFKQRQASYWHRTRQLTFALLLLWFAVTFAVVFFARELSEWTLFGWSLSYFMAAQGAIFIYVLIVAFYAWRMRRIDRLVADGQAHGK